MKGEPFSKQNQSLKHQRMDCKHDILEGAVHYNKDSWAYTGIAFGMDFPFSLFLPAHYFKTKDVKKSFHSSAIHIYQVIESESGELSIYLLHGNGESE